ncbi:hypothetical protein DXD97_09880 [Ruminococcus sp. TM10-9AT]|nr:hypothetical protein DXD97_09880 [Ruminococcus sp. TM10-9AT]
MSHITNKCGISADGEYLIGYYNDVKFKSLIVQARTISDLLILTSYNMSAAQYEYKMKEDKRHEHRKI